ncbi:hypothetical protein ASE86_00780 [Sphingomonas sp. Leaf33]|uniref:response regulator n=1 Tax=Sphingomonas sp. Leaf33 TaxID=1736215 RepID=UPI0006F3EF96|nr:response regulator transcription factor [Sphingomonas sp. Leaf33]KQN24863.1 hypothetical protein ASE86_00780 [Sphingomonas sp. Leaf33]
MIDTRPASRVASPTILVVDDSRTNRDVLCRRLTQSGFAVLPCDSGRQALVMIDHGDIDLVLLDMVMPEMSGVAVLGELRGSPKTADLPVIVITGRSDPAAAVEALAAGADDWIAKPFSFDMLVARIDRILARSARRSDRPRPGTSADATIDRSRLIASIRALSDEVARLSGSSAAS